MLTISSTGVVTGVSDGTTTVTYTDANSCSISVNFTVNDLPTVSAGRINPYVQEVRFRYRQLMLLERLLAGTIVFQIMSPFRLLQPQPIP